MKNLKTFLLVIIAVAGIGSTNAQTEDAATIANKLQNPLARISALPIQHNIGMGSPTFEGSTYTMLLQPLVGMEYKKFNLVHRAVVGAAHLPAMSNGGGQTFGMTDLNYSVLFAPKTVNKVIWGFGPSIDMPTATDQILGTGKWSAGASLVLVYQTPTWTFDMVFRQTASFAGDKERKDVNMFVAQTLIAYNVGKGWLLNTFPTVQANWSADKGQQWTVPVGGGINKVAFLGKMPVNFGVQYYHNVVRPNHAPKDELRFVTTFVFNK